MKRAELQRTQANNNSDDQADCLCEAICAADLSKVGSSECTCSDCEEAMLEAYNEYLSQSNHPNNKQRPKQISYDKQKQNKTTTDKNLGYNEQRHRKKKQERLRSTFNRSPRFELSSSKYNEYRSTCNRSIIENNKRKTHKSLEHQQEHIDFPDYQPQIFDINPTKYDYNQAEMQFYVDQKIKQNLKKHRNKEKGSKKQKQQELKRRKLALQIVNLNAKESLQKNLNLQSRQNIPEQKHKIPWNYQLQKEQVKVQDQHCHKIPIKRQTDTGLNKESIQQEIQTRIKQRKELIKLQIKQARGALVGEMSAQNESINQKCQFDNCQKHHMNTSPRTIQKITQKIEKNAQKYMQKLKKQKKEKQEAQKLKESKLRALALKAKQKLDKAPKVGMKDISSFHLTIQNHSTFSEIKNLKQQKLRQKQFSRQLKQEINSGARKPVADIKDKLKFEDQGSEIKKPSFSKEKQMQFRKSTSKQREKIKKQDSSQQIMKSRKVSKEKMQQTLRQMQRSLNKNVKVRELRQQLEDSISDPNSKFYVWDMPLGDKQIKKIFDEAKLPQPRKNKNYNSSNFEEGKQKIQSKFREQVNNKIQENIKKKLKDKDKEKKQNFIDQKVRQKKQEIVREYRKMKDQQTNLQKAESSKNSTQTKSKIKNNKQLKSQFVKKIEQKDNKKIKQNHSRQRFIKQPQKMQFSSQSDVMYQNKATSSLRENQIFSENDKKIFVMNSQMLAGTKHLKV